MAVKTKASDKSKALGKHKAVVKPNEKISSGQSDFSHLAEDIISNISIGIYIVQKGKFVYLSPLFLELSGYSQADLVGTNPLDYIHPDDREVVRTKAISNLKGKSTTNYEYRFIRKNKQIIWVLEMVTPIVYKGEPAGLGSFMDITARKRTEAALQKSEEKHRTILENMQEGYFEVDLAGNFTYFNNSTCILIGYSPEEMIGMNNRQYTDKEYAKKLFQTFNEVYKTGKPTKAFDWQVVRKDGSKRFIEASVALQIDSSGKPIGFKGVIHDITERKQAEESYRNIFLNSQIGLFRTDVNTGLLLDANDAVARFIGFQDRASLLAEPFNIGVRYVNPDDRKKMISLLQGDGEFQNLEARFLKNDGSIVLMRFSGKLIKEKGWLEGVSEDITERRALESQLQQAQKMESVGRLAGGVAHDFNNMLGVILGQTEMALLKVDSSQPIHGRLKEILKAAERSAELTRQLLAFARKQTVAPKVINLNEIVAGVLKMLKRLIGENIDLNWQPAADLWLVNVDPSQIDQILANLCVNARDAISGVGKMTIETANITIDEEYCAINTGLIPGEYVQISVSDNGCGMDKGTLSHIFEPFFTTKNVGEGTGLGLATVYGAVKQNNGFINAYSEPSQGTTFTVYLPRYVGKAQQSQIEGAPRSDMQGKETILLVEDEPSIVEITMSMLEMQGYKVLAASSPGEAMRLARENKGEIHLLMTDVIMPEMNGRDLAKNMLTLYPQLKRLFMSGYTANVIAHHGVLDEGVNFIQKPFSIKELAAKVREALDRQ